MFQRFLAATLFTTLLGSVGAPVLGAKKGADPVIEMNTNYGKIKLQLDKKKAPVTVGNFVQYVKNKFYDGTVFHRVIDGFMIQGGGFIPDGKALKQKKTKQPIKLEAQNGLKNDQYTIAMARTGDPNSATSQFFINVVNNDRLNYPSPDGHGYAVFGKVISGQAAIEKIRKIKTTSKTAKTEDGKLMPRPLNDVPEKDVVIKSVRLVSG